MEFNSVDQPRKKIRKGTRSCWECKHRKVRCNFTSENDRSCRECLVRGIPCRSQDLPEPENPRESDRVGLNERLARVESRLETIVPRIDEILQRLESLGTNQGQYPLPVRLKNEPLSSEVIQDNAPIMGLFKDATKPETDVPSSTAYSSINPNWQRLRQELIALIPPAETLEIMSEASTSWWLMRKAWFEDIEPELLPVPVEALWESHPAFIGKAVLWIASCLQQLPPEVDIDRLKLPCTPALLIQKAISTVATLVCSDDSLVTCIDGLECLTLQSVMFGNNGKIRSAWLSCRRAIDAAQIIGYHRETPVATENAPFRRRAMYIWRYLVFTDRLYSITLGVHAAISNAAIELHQSNEEFSDMPGRSRFLLDPLTRIAGSIIDRNQTFTKVNPAMIKMTLKIDAEFEPLSTPTIFSPSEEDIPSAGEARERLLAFISLNSQLCFYQLKAWLHLPLLLEASREIPYDYHRRVCLNASRNLIKCYLNLRNVAGSEYASQIVDFVAFTAAMTLVINAIGPFGPQDFNQDDMDAVESLTAILDHLSQKAPADNVVSRCAHVLSTLRAVSLGHDYPPSVGPNDESGTTPDRPSRIKLDIPYFGTVYLERHTWESQATKSTPASSTGTPWRGTDWDPNASFNEYADATQKPITDSSAWPTEFWALGNEFTFQPPFLADFDIDWSLCDFGLN
ncbi:unnamed protein product [Penicillium salamii]|nr:unnamed protein product [Penicillium salamii]